MQWWCLHFLIKYLYFFSYAISNMVALDSALFWCWNWACASRGPMIPLIAICSVALMSQWRLNSWTLVLNPMSFFIVVVQLSHIISAWMTRVFKWHLVDTNWLSSFLAFQQEQADNTCYLQLVIHSHNGCFAVLS